MDCHSFKTNHVAFGDGTLSDAELVAMQRHVAECAACSAHDAAVRRALLVFRNLPPIEPSSDFATKLGQRLRDERVRGALEGARRAPVRGPGIGSFATMALGVMAVGYLAVTTFGAGQQPPVELTLPPVVASLPEPPAAPMASGAVVTTAAAGMPLWSAALVAEQAPMHFAANEFQLASFRR